MVAVIGKVPRRRGDITEITIKTFWKISLRLRKRNGPEVKETERRERGRSFKCLHMGQEQDCTKDCDAPPPITARPSPSRVLARTSFASFLFFFLRYKRGLLSSYLFRERALQLFLCFYYCTYSCCKMEEKKSSFVDEFFPPKEASSPPKSDILSSIFPPQSPIVVKDSFHYELLPVRIRKHVSECLGSTEKIEPQAEPCLLSSSVYYGGRDDFAPESSSSYNSGSTYNFQYKNDNEDSCNSNLANRGEWWQGSFYY